MVLTNFANFAYLGRGMGNLLALGHHTLDSPNSPNNLDNHDNELSYSHRYMITLS